MSSDSHISNEFLSLAPRDFFNLLMVRVRSCVCVTHIKLHIIYPPLAHNLQTSNCSILLIFAAFKNSGSKIVDERPK